MNHDTPISIGTEDRPWDVENDACSHGVDDDCGCRCGPVYYTSTTRNGETGDLRILERSSGKETIIASDLTTEDAHRAACRQWAAGGTKVVYHDCRNGRWRVVAVDITTLKPTIVRVFGCDCSGCAGCAASEH